MVNDVESSLEGFESRLARVLWPERDENGALLWQVDELWMRVTGSGGSPDLLRMVMTPGREGLFVFNVVDPDHPTVHVADAWGNLPLPKETTGIVSDIMHDVLVDLYHALRQAQANGDYEDVAEDQAQIEALTAFMAYQGWDLP